MPDKAEHVFARDNALRALSSRLEKIFGRGPARRGLLLDLEFLERTRRVATDDDNHPAAVFRARG
jgi:hypothetical protein